MLPKNRVPSLPGEILQEEFLLPLKMTQSELAAQMGVPIQRVNGLVRGRRSVSAETALLLAKILGTSPQFWMNLQTNYDLWVAQKQMARRIHAA